MAAQAILFAGGVWAAWNLFASEGRADGPELWLAGRGGAGRGADDQTLALPVVHINRIVHELKRLQVQIGPRDGL